MFERNQILNKVFHNEIEFLHVFKHQCYRCSFPNMWCLFRQLFSNEKHIDQNSSSGSDRKHRLFIRAYGLFIKDKCKPLSFVCLFIIYFEQHLFACKSYRISHLHVFYVTVVSIDQLYSTIISHAFLCLFQSLLSQNGLKLFKKCKSTARNVIRC